MPSVEPPKAPVPFVPENAPFSTEQRAWLNGYLAGMFADAGAGAPPAAASAPALTLHILYGSQTGNAETLARQAAKQAKSKGMAVESAELDAFDRGALKDVNHLLIITSTYGDGEPPDNAREFYDFLYADDAPRLESLEFAMLGLGDSSYPDFNQCAKDIEKRLLDLGAKSKKPALLCDLEFEEPAQAFLDELWTELAKAAPAAENGVPGTNGKGENGVPGTSGDAKEAEPKASAYGKKNPFAAEVRHNENLNGAESAKATQHVEISLEGSDLVYEAGDALGVLPSNDLRLIDEFILAAGFQHDEPTPLPDKSEGPLAEALRRHYDITGLTPAFVQACARLSKNEELQAIVRDEAALKAYVEGRQMVDPVLQYGIKFPTTEYLIAPLKQIQPRLYSISSSPKAHPGEVHITVGVVRYESHGRERQGVCSNFLARLKAGGKVPVYIQPNKQFRPPSDPEAPLIMVGPGTGVAPFRAFLEERQATGAKGRNWLFFGDQKSSCDFLYQDQLEGLKQAGVLTRLDTAFSRDGAEKVYVQHRMREQSEELFAWLEAGASFCVCGDAKRMAKDVEQALLEIIASEGGFDAEGAEAYLSQMKKKKRYLRDVY
ncbi:MAG: sulfite reductase subunit alpha [Opitutales bacterium]|nr:sulfite reductase subunit alpha [Opitutales bacterium]